jgi:hypothetical protein
MRRFLVSIALTLAGVLLVGTQPALALARTVETIPPITGAVESVCAFTATADQRNDRTLTTWSDRNGSVVLQSVRTRTLTTFANPTSGVVLDAMPENYAVATKPDADGTGTILFAGRGAIWGTDTGLGQPFFLWVTGVVSMKGTYDAKTGSFFVSSKRVFGQSTDLCESLVTGLKPRH